jgi:glutamyl-Q tRNA(Asp) synthetase
MPEVTTARTAYRGRFAPSPTGDLHFGSLYAALASWLRARQQGGEWLVRIEDIDPPREVPGSAQRILATLAACGMESDRPVEWQSRRIALYADALEFLRARGLAFECRCSRKRLAASGLHHGVCRAPKSTRHRPSAWRLLVPEVEIGFDDVVRGPLRQDLWRHVGDFVLRRVEGYYAYQLAVVVDDAAQGVSEVVRGGDLLDSTARQIYLQRLLGVPTPGYLHVPLVVDGGGRKLSKQYLSAPVSPDDPVPALRLALELLGVPPEALSDPAGPASLLHRAAAHFDPARIPRSPTLAL